MREIHGMRNTVQLLTLRKQGATSQGVYTALEAEQAMGISILQSHGTEFSKTLSKTASESTLWNFQKDM